MSEKNLNSFINLFNDSKNINETQERIIERNKILDDIYSYISKNNLELNFDNYFYSSNTEGHIITILTYIKYLIDTNINTWAKSKIYLIDKLTDLLCDSKNSDYILNFVRIILFQIIDTKNIMYFTHYDCSKLRNIFENKNYIFKDNNDSKKYISIVSIINNFLNMTDFLSSSYKQQMYNITNYKNPTSKHLLCSITGKAVADSIGFLVEGSDRNTCSNYVNNFVKNYKVVNCGIHKYFGQKQNFHRYYDLQNLPSNVNMNDISFNYGQYTDDTQLARELLCSFKMTPGEKLDINIFSERLALLFSKSNVIFTDNIERIQNLSQKYNDINSGIVGYGKTTKQAAQLYLNGFHHTDVSKINHGSGNGAPMRSGPLGILFYDKQHIFHDTVIKQARCTHSSVNAAASSIMMAEATKLAFQFSNLGYAKIDIEKHPDVFCEILARNVKIYSEKLSNLILSLPRFIEQWNHIENFEHRISSFIPFLTKHCKDNFNDSLWLNGQVISGSAIQSSVWAIFCFLVYPKNYLDCICLSILGGGDTDTTAAMAGSISAVYTSDTFLDEYKIFIERINDCGNFKFEEFRKLCENIM